MLVVNWRESAIADLEEITTYIFAVNPAAAINLNGAVLLAAERLVGMPYSGRGGRKKGTRELVFSPSYIIVYEITAHTIDIVNVIHTSRLYP